MEARFDFTDVEFGRRSLPEFVAAAKTLTDSPLSSIVQELVKIRASQINGCAVCTDMHTKDALALTEQATRIADSVGVDDDTWETARKHFGDEELAALIVVIAVINAFDRFNVIVRAPAGDYQPGLYG